MVHELLHGLQILAFILIGGCLWKIYLIIKQISKEKMKEEKKKSKLKKKKLTIVKKHKMNEIVKIVETENSKPRKWN